MVRTIHRLCCLALVVAGAAPATGFGREGSFADRLEGIAALVEDKEWRQVREELHSLLSTDLDIQAAYLNRPRIVEWLTESAFWLQYEVPGPKELLPNTLLKYGEKTGNIRLRYRTSEAESVMVFRDRKVVYKPTGVQPGDFVIHPARFSGPYGIELRGERHPDPKEGLPGLICIDPGRFMTTVFGSQESRGYWAPGQMVLVDFLKSSRTIDQTNEPKPVPRERFRLTLKMDRRSVKATYNGRPVLGGRKPADFFGMVGWSVFPGLEEIEIWGKVHRSWIQGKKDDAVNAARKEFLKTFDVNQELPEVLRLEGHAARLFPDEGYPGEQRSGQDVRLEKLREHLNEGRPKKAKKLIEDDGDTTEAFREFASSMIAFYEADFVSARSHCERVLELEPEFPTARRMRIWLDMRDGKRAAAYDALSTWVAEDPADPWVYPELVVLALLAGEPEQAAEWTRAAIGQEVYGPELETYNEARWKSGSGPILRERFVHESEHYRVVSDIDRLTCIESAELLESIRKNFASRFVEIPRGKLSPVYVFSGEESYLRYARSALLANAESSAGLYSPVFKQLLIWNLPDRENMLRTVRHEGVHQIMDSLAESVPAWLHEGMAEYFAGSDFARLGDRQFPANDEHVFVLTQLELAPLADFLFEDHATFMQDHVRSYAQSWALVHFLRHGPKRHRARLDTLLSALFAGTDGREALEAAFEDSALAELDYALKRHVTELRKQSR